MALNEQAERVTVHEGERGVCLYPLMITCLPCCAGCLCGRCSERVPADYPELPHPLSAWPSRAAAA